MQLKQTFLLVVTLPCATIQDFFFLGEGVVGHALLLICGVVMSWGSLTTCQFGAGWWHDGNGWEVHGDNHGGFMVCPR